MTFRASFLYALRLFFSHPSTEKNSHGGRSLLGAVLCIGISLVPLVAVLVISSGMIDGITGRIIGLSSQDLQVRVNSYSADVDSYEKMLEIKERLSGIDGVTGVYPEMQGMALASANGIRTGATVRGVSPDIFTGNSSFASLFKICDGNVDLSDERCAVLGEKIAETLGVRGGDKISLIAVNKIGERFVPKMSQFTVTAIVSSGYQELDALWVFIPLETAFTSLSPKSSQFIFGLTTPDPFASSLGAIKKAVHRNILGFDGEEPLDKSRVYSWNELNATEFENFSSTKILLLLIMLLIVLVASVNISSALVMIVMERRKEIAILKSVGASSSGITTSFLAVGFGAGVGGVLLGIPLGLLVGVNINGLVSFTEKLVNICAKVVYLIGNGNAADFEAVRLLDPAYYLQNIPVTVPFGELLLIVIGTLMLSLLVSAIPAIKGGKEKPLDTLRKM